MKFSFNILLLLVYSISSLTISAQSIITDRPDQTESAVTLEAGRLQIESGVLNQSQGKGLDRLRSLIIPTNLFRYGISKKVELRMVLQLDGEKTNADKYHQFALGNVEIGAKFVLNKKVDPAVQLAILSHIRLPKDNWVNFRENLGFLNRVSIAHRVGKFLNIGYNFGYNHYTKGYGNFVYTLAVGAGITNRISIYVEPYGDITTDSSPTSNFDYGVAYLINPNIQLDLSFGLGLNNKMSYQSVGISWRQKTKETP